MDIMRKIAYFLVSPILVDSYAFLFSCTTGGGGGAGGGVLSQTPGRADLNLSLEICCLMCVMILSRLMSIVALFFLVFSSDTFSTT